MGQLLPPEVPGSLHTQAVQRLKNRPWDPGGDGQDRSRPWRAGGGQMDAFNTAALPLVSHNSLALAILAP